MRLKGRTIAVQNDTRVPDFELANQFGEHVGLFDITEWTRPRRVPRGARRVECTRRVVAWPDLSGIDYPNRETARAITRASTINAPDDSATMRAFARVLSGIASVGLNAIELDAEKYT